MRITPKGFQQVKGPDFKATFAPVAKFSSIRALCALAARLNLGIQQADVDSAFPQADLPKDEIVYMALPDSMRHLPKYRGKVLRLMYGLKQSG